MVEYRFRTMKPGSVQDECNKEAEEGFLVEKMIKEANQFHVLFIKWPDMEENEELIPEFEVVAESEKGSLPLEE